MAALATSVQPPDISVQPDTGVAVVLAFIGQHLLVGHRRQFLASPGLSSSRGLSCAAVARRRAVMILADSQRLTNSQSAVGGDLDVRNWLRESMGRGTRW